ncbi:hypothetical protein AB0I60_01765 [Actinosynnema sp. NPDC050436]|uniref:hypothetical protein n=1 Tax=Actinosynnema sp. NPDC050436 TaxID=3155659 RepID=UPI003404C9A6
MLTETLGAQVAWWQLGFAARREVLRAARLGCRVADPDVRQVSADWARQWLTAPRWWWAVRGVGTAVVAVVCPAGAAISLVEVDGLVALLGAVVGCGPPCAWWFARQSRNARAIVRAHRDPQVEPVPSPGLALRAAAVVVAVGAAVASLAVAITYNRSVKPECPPFAVDQEVREWRERDQLGCPTGDTLVGPGGVRHTPWAHPDEPIHPKDDVVYVTPDAGPVLMPAPIFHAWTATGGPAGPLGEPEEGADTGSVTYFNFRGGSVLFPPGGQPEVHRGRKHSWDRAPGGPCEQHDRPCVTDARADGTDVRISWRYGTADAFNVRWGPRDRQGAMVQRESAGFEFTLPDLVPSTAYVVTVSACRKQFLRRSVCTPFSVPVIVRAG